MEPQEEIQKPIVTQPEAEKPTVRTYFFPNEGVNIEATSPEEAAKKLADLNKTNK